MNENMHRTHEKYVEGSDREVHMWLQSRLDLSHISIRRRRYNGSPQLTLPVIDWFYQLRSFLLDQNHFLPHPVALQMSGFRGFWAVVFRVNTRTSSASLPVVSLGSLRRADRQTDATRPVRSTWRDPTVRLQAHLSRITAIVRLCYSIYMLGRKSDHWYDRWTVPISTSGTRSTSGWPLYIASCLGIRERWRSKSETKLHLCTFHIWCTR